MQQPGCLSISLCAKSDSVDRTHDGERQPMRIAIDLGRSLHPGAALLSPRGKVLENGMPRFFRRLSEGVFDEEDLIRRTHELADFVAAAAAEYQLQNRKIVAVGYSNGANIAASVLLLRPGTLAGAVLLRAMLPLVPENLQSCRDSECSLPPEEGTLCASRKYKSTCDPARQGRR